jgi:hypothetical protein
MVLTYKNGSILRNCDFVNHLSIPAFDRVRERDRCLDSRIPTSRRYGGHKSKYLMHCCIQVCKRVERVPKISTEASETFYVKQSGRESLHPWIVIPDRSNFFPQLILDVVMLSELP